MLEVLQQWDAALFQWVNSSIANPVFDAILPWCREKWFWAPVYLFIVSFTLLNFGARRGWLIIGGLILAVGLSDFTSSTLVKKNVQRLRPCNDPEMAARVQPRAPCGGGYSFTSSHAANHFAAAVFLIGIFGNLHRRVRRWALSWASIIAFSQVYVGVHYPADVLCGALLGTAIGWWVLHTYRRFWRNDAKKLES